MKRIILCLSFFLACFSIQAQSINTPNELFVKPSNISAPGYCEIEVANQSALGAYVDIQYDNGDFRANNYVAPGYSLYIPLHYYGYCHSYATLSIRSIYNDFLFYGAAYVGHTVSIVPGLKENKLSVTTH